MIHRSILEKNNEENEGGINQKLGFLKTCFGRLKSDDYVSKKLFVNDKGIILEKPNEMISNFAL